MINVTQKFIELLNANSRTFRMKLVNGSEEYTNILNLKWFAALPPYLSIGNAICTCVQCSAVGIPISIKGTYLDVYITVIGSDEWVQIGTFKAEKPTLQNGVVSFSAYDIMNECSKAIFTHKLGTVTVGECYETVITTIENEIGTVSYVPLSSSVASLKINADMLCGYDCRNVLAYIAGYLGCNCVVNNTGSIEMRGFKVCDYTLNDNRIAEPELDDDVSDLEFLACSIDSDTKLLYGNNGEGFEFICPIMTQERLNEIGATMCASTSPINVYRSGKIKHLLGDLRLQIGDVIYLEHSGETHIVPISSIAFEFDGGLSADIEAFPLAEASSLSLAETLDFVSKQNANKRIKGITNYYLATSIAEGVTKSTEGWSEEVQTVSAEKKYLWNYEAIEFADGTLYETDPCIIGNFAADGRGISKITEYYATTSSTVAPEKKAFSTEVKTPTESLPYLWNYEKIDYSDGSKAYESDIRLIGVYSKNGDNGKTYYTWIKYADDENGTNMSDSPSGKNYVGIATNKTTATESTQASDYIWSLFKGQGVISIKTQYYRSTSNTTQTGGSWSYDMPEWVDGTYLWKREVTTFENPSGTNYGTAVLDTSWDALGDLNKNLSATEKASKEFNESLINALGFYVTEVPDTGVKYYHSKSPLASCGVGDIILVFNSGGFGVCTKGWNGGSPEFDNGMDFGQGKAIWNILVANNISADNIEAGVIKSIASAAVQTKLNLNDGTMSFETGNTLVTVQGATTDSDGVERKAGLLIQDKSTNNYFGISLDGFAYMTAEYAIAMIKYLLGSGPKPEDPYFSEVREQSIKTKDIHCQNIYVLNEGVEENLVDALTTVGSRIVYHDEALTALQEKYTSLEEALGQQHEHTAATAVKENIVAPTCTESGSYDSVVYCATCGEEIRRQTITTEATGHDYTSVVTPPTETAQGYTTHTCKNCGHSYKDNYTDTVKYFTAKISSSGASSSDTVYISGDANGSTNYGTQKQSNTIGETMYCFAKAGSGRVISQIVTSTGQTITADDLEGVNALNADHTQLAYPMQVVSAFLGSTMEITVYFEDESSGELTIVTGETKSININAGEITYLKFIPSTSGTYEFTSLGTSDDDVVGYLYDANNSQIATDDDTAGSRQFLLTQELTAGTTYYWGVKYYSTSKTGSVNVKLTYKGSGGSSGGDTSETVSVEIYALLGTESQELGSVNVQRNGVDVTNSSTQYSFVIGDTVTLTATPYSGSSFLGWLSNGTWISRVATYTFTVSSDTPTQILAYFNG